MVAPETVDTQRLLPDTEGAGRYRGAPSAFVEYGPVGTSLFVAYGADGVVNPALGARGGLPGGACRHFRRATDGGLTELPALGVVELRDGERIVSITCGGGGYGPPAEREPEAVRRDVVEGWISAERGREVYRVALTEEMEVAVEETSAMRSGGKAVPG